MRLIAAHRTVLVPSRLRASWRELCLCQCSSLLIFEDAVALSAVFVVTTVVSLMHLDRKTRDFRYRLEFGSQPQVFSQGDALTLNLS